MKGEGDTNGDGILTSAELYAYLEPNVAQTALINWRAAQNPQIGRAGQGEFVFLIKDAPVPARPDSPRTSQRTEATAREAASTPTSGATPPRIKVPPSTPTLDALRPTTVAPADQIILKLTDYGKTFSNDNTIYLPSSNIRGARSCPSAG